MAELELTEDGGVLTITINRPAARNAIDATVARGIAEAIERLDAEPDLRVGVITGAGGYFSAGMDLKAFAATGERPHVPGRGFAGIVERPPSKPLIAAIEGFALAGGLEIALACDLLVAARGARLGIPEAKRGLVAAGGALLRLPQLLPRTVVLELALTGEPLSAERAHELGLVNALTEPGQALAQAQALAARIAQNAPLSLNVSKAIVREGAAWSADEAFERQRPLVAAVMESEDAREGARAFTEKRAPHWQGR